MKLARYVTDLDAMLSPSPRKAWIETGRRLVVLSCRVWSPSPRKAWIETSDTSHININYQSPSPRKAWIETRYAATMPRRTKVAFPPEGVD